LKDQIDFKGINRDEDLFLIEALDFV